MKSVTMATKREMSDYTVFFSVLGHKKFIHKILAKSESVRFQPLFKFFWCSQRIALKNIICSTKIKFFWSRSRYGRVSLPRKANNQSQKLKRCGDSEGFMS